MAHKTTSQTLRWALSNLNKVAQGARYATRHTSNPKTQTRTYTLIGTFGSGEIVRSWQGNSKTIETAINALTWAYTQLPQVKQETVSEQTVISNVEPGGSEDDRFAVTYRGE